MRNKKQNAVELTAEEKQAIIALEKIEHKNSMLNRITSTLDSVICKNNKERGLNQVT